jgi:hypothetical protein
MVRCGYGLSGPDYDQTHLIPLADTQFLNKGQDVSCHKPVLIKTLLLQQQTT